MSSVDLPSVLKSAAPLATPTPSYRLLATRAISATCVSLDPLSLASAPTTTASATLASVRCVIRNYLPKSKGPLSQTPNCATKATNLDLFQAASRPPATTVTRLVLATRSVRGVAPTTVCSARGWRSTITSVNTDTMWKRGKSMPPPSATSASSLSLRPNPSTMRLAGSLFAALAFKKSTQNPNASGGSRSFTPVQLGILSITTQGRMRL